MIETESPPVVPQPVATSTNLITNPETLEYREASHLVSLGKLFALLEVTPTPMQENIIKLFDDHIEDWSELNLVASRRSGKTFTLAIMVVLELLKPHSSTLLVSKSAKSLTNNFNEIVKFVKQLGLPITKLNTQQYQLTVNGNAHLRCTVHKTMDGLIGSRASMIMLDECGTYNYSEDYDRLLGPMRLDYGSYVHDGTEGTATFVSKVVRVSSPRTIGSDFHVDYEKGIPPLAARSSSKNWRNNLQIFNGVVSLRYNIFDSPLLTPDLIEAIRISTLSNKSEGMKVWQTEYLAEFIHMSATRAFTEFTINHLYNVQELLDKIKPQPNDPPLALFVGVDIGFTDRSAIVIGTVLDNTMYILDHYSASGLRTEPLALKITEMLEKWELNGFSVDEGALYIDPAAALSRADLAEDHDIENLPAYNKIKWGIDTINELFKTNSLSIPDDQPEFKEQIEGLSFKEIADGMAPDGVRGDPFVRVKGHHFDSAHAFRYLVASVKRYWGLPEGSDALPEGPDM